MADTAKGNTDTQDTTGAKDVELVKDHGRKSEDREFGQIHRYTFEDGTGAKVWDTTKGHVSVLLTDADGRGFSDTLKTDVTVAAANELLEKAAQVAKDKVATEKAAQ